MGFIRKISGAKDAALAGNIQAQGARDALAATEASAQQGLGFLDPFGQLGQTGLDQASFLTDPQQQFDFLQGNPLFQMGLDNLNRTTQNVAAQRGRLSAGDTLLELNNNALLAASPLIAGQKQSIGNLLNFGQGTAANQANIATGQGANAANLITDAAGAQAGGLVGAGNAQRGFLTDVASIAAPFIPGFPG